jgi:5,10-methylene-tetrahydrofolate dehydrogenase/methenyl tetrahydrofolate cyclohydrolase
MRVVVIGATGVVGSAVGNALANCGYEVLRASRQGPISVNIADAVSIAVTLQNKFVGPMNLVRSGVSHMRDGGVFVLMIVSKILLCHDADPDLFLLPPGVTRVIGDTRRRV